MDNFIEGLLAQLFGDDGESGPSQQETREAVQGKINTVRGLWHGDDTDALVARRTIDACEAYLMSVTEHGAISHMLHRSISDMMGESTKTIDRLARIGIVRTIAQGRPTPDKVEWLTRDESEGDT